VASKGICAISHCPGLLIGAKGFARSSPQSDRRHGVRGPRGQLLLKGGACAIAAGDATGGSALDGNWPPPG
jgi:hypothetical protein